MRSAMVTPLKFQPVPSQTPWSFAPRPLEPKALLNVLSFTLETAVRDVQPSNMDVMLVTLLPTWRLERSAQRRFGRLAKAL